MVKVHFKRSIPLVFQGLRVQAPTGAAFLPWFMYIDLAILMSKINVCMGTINFAGRVKHCFEWDQLELNKCHDGFIGSIG